jgi:hypothetical protein
MNPETHKLAAMLQFKWIDCALALLAVVASLGAQDKSVADICQVLRNSEAYNLNPAHLPPPDCIDEADQQGFEAVL